MYDLLVGSNKEEVTKVYEDVDGYCWDCDFNIEAHTDAKQVLVMVRRHVEQNEGHLAFIDMRLCTKEERVRGELSANRRTP